MPNSQITPVILAGGSGTRLWPVSREDLPKQFCKLGERSLFQETVCRFMKQELFTPPLILTGESHLAIARQQLCEIGAEALGFICEPCGRDTAAAIALATEHPGLSNDSILLVLPSDHKIQDATALTVAVGNCKRSAEQDGLIVTFGITPTEPHTGYGYIRCGEHLVGSHLVEVTAFIEKPDASLAQRLIKDRNVYWNAGIFLASRDTLRSELAAHSQPLLAQISRAAGQGTIDGAILRPHRDVFAQIDPVSFDYAVMEKSDRTAIIPIDPKWSDMGSWGSVYETTELDGNGNALGSSCHAVDTSTSIVQSMGPVVGVAGVENLCVIATPDAVLVADKDNPQAVKKLVQSMREQGIAAATNHVGEDRPWGRFDSVDRGETHQVKRIRVDPGQQLSLQYHHHRSEHFVVVRGTVRFTVDGIVSDLSVGERIFVPLGAIHRMENVTREPVEVIEIQIGDYLGEDDIVRVEDIYGRLPASTNRNDIAA